MTLNLPDPSAVMSYGGLVDASTAGGQVDEEADWRGAVAALLDANVASRVSGSAETNSLSTLGSRRPELASGWDAHERRAGRLRPSLQGTHRAAQGRAESRSAGIATEQDVQRP